MDAQSRYDSLFRYYGELYSVSWTLLKAQGLAESLLDPDAVSRTGAMGIMQFMPKTWQEWWDQTAGIQGLPGKRRDNPEANIAGGAAYMRQLYEHFRDHNTVLAAYNWGWGNVERHLKRHGGVLAPFYLPSETRNYIKRIHRWKDRLDGV